MSPSWMGCSTRIAVMAAPYRRHGAIVTHTALHRPAIHIMGRRLDTEHPEHRNLREDLHRGKHHHEWLAKPFGWIQMDDWLDLWTY